MRLKLLIPILFFANIVMSQDTIVAYKKRILEKTEIDIIGSYYSQNGNNSSVAGGIGSEKLSDIASVIKISIPLNADDILRVEGGVSSYTSASSSNLNPFDLGYNKEESLSLTNPTGRRRARHRTHRSRTR